MSSNKQRKPKPRQVLTFFLTTFSIICSALISLLSYLRKESDEVIKADKYLRFLRSSANKGAGNLVFSKKLLKSEVKQKIRDSDYWSWIQSADYHYFISRALFLNNVREYSLFAGHQCVENYLKAYIRYRGHTPKMKHDLISLLEDCRCVAAAGDLFIFSDQALVVSERYNPFYELARYPIHSIRPDGGYSIVFPLDLVVLDYFVYRMREIMPSSGKSWDIFVDGHHDLFLCQKQHPDFYSLLLKGNLNFGGSLDNVSA